MLLVEYVTCRTCKSPDTDLKKGENRLFFVTCNSCGSRRSVAFVLPKNHNLYLILTFHIVLSRPVSKLPLGKEEGRRFKFISVLPSEHYKSVWYLCMVSFGNRMWCFSVWPGYESGYSAPKTIHKEITREWVDVMAFVNSPSVAVDIRVRFFSCSSCSSHLQPHCIAQPGGTWFPRLVILLI